jgi:enediyne biosynthesis protein E4
VYICGAREDMGKLLIQTKEGKFKLSEQKDFIEDSFFEDTDAAIFDIDSDGDNDLIVCSGGNEPLVQSIAYATRIYLNDGKGNLKADISRSPQKPINASCVKPCDFDHDGDIDLFIGARSVPGKYGVTPQSMLLKNDDGYFTDISSNELSRIGMVTDAVWQDLNNDKLEDLIVVGEWMPIVMLQNNGTNLVSAYGVENTNGWWNIIKANDIDGDGDVDFVLGNWGENFKFKASSEKPMELYVGDFDSNETIDPIITMYSSDGMSYPYSSKGDLTAQIPITKKKFVHYRDYANKTIGQIFDKDVLKNSFKRHTDTFSSGILFNNNGKFEFKPFPAQAQFAPIFAIEISDFDADGFADIFLAGNFLDLKPEIGRLDATQTIVLKGNGKGNFEYLANRKHGLVEKGQIRSSKMVSTANKKQILFLGLNNEALRTYMIKK